MAAAPLPKIETLETPTQKMVRESNPIRTVVDSMGRTIRYKNLSILERARLARVLSEDARNPIYFNMLATAACIIDIDGDPGPPKTTVNFLEGRLGWLGDDGWDAMIKDDRERVEAEDKQDDRDAIKN
jgi:hypothetical protein